MRKNILSLDLEHDYGGDVFSKYYALEVVKAWSKETLTPVNIFIEGRLLFNDKVVDIIGDWHGDINLHCFDHTRPFDRRIDIRKSQEIFSSVFGYKAKGYRSTRYTLNREIIEALIEYDFQFDSSLMFNPYRKNIYNTIHDEIKNIKGFGLFRCQTGDLLEFPIGFIDTIYYPMVVSYINLVGFKAFSLMTNLFLKSPLQIIDFHLVDIEPALGNLNPVDGLLINSAYRYLANRNPGISSLSKITDALSGDFSTYTKLIESLRVAA